MTSSCSSKFLKRLRELEDYKQQEGHCDVPNTFPQNQGLSNWVRNQRYKFNNIKSIGKEPTPIHKEDISKLNQLGFAWTVKKSPKTQMFMETVDRVQMFKKEHPALWRTANFNHDSSNLPKEFQDLPTLCEDVQGLRISRERKKVLKHLRVKLLNTETISPASMGDVVFKEGGEKSEFEKVNRNKIPEESISTLPDSMGDVVLKGGEKNELEKVNSKKEIPNKLRRSTRWMKT